MLLDTLVNGVGQSSTGTGFPCCGVRLGPGQIYTIPSDCLIRIAPPSTSKEFLTYTKFGLQTSPLQFSIYLHITLHNAHSTLFPVLFPVPFPVPWGWDSLFRGWDAAAWPRST